MNRPAVAASRRERWPRFAPPLFDGARVGARDADDHRGNGRELRAGGPASAAVAPDSPSSPWPSPTAPPVDFVGW